MKTPISDTHRTVLRTLADTVVPSLRRPDDTTGFWARSGSDLHANIAVEHALSGLPEDELAGMLALLDGLHVLGFVTGSERSREQLIRNVALMGTRPAAAINALISLTLAFAYAGPDPRTANNPMWAGFGYPGAPGIEPGGAEAPTPFVPAGSQVTADVCIVGSGAGGGLIAGMLAQSGLDDVVLAEAHRLGDPFDADTKMGPLVSAEQRERVREHIRRGIDEGARLVTGGPDAPEGLQRGYFVAPTVLSAVRSDMAIAQEEVFGPVLSILGYEDEEDAIRIANDSRFGLSGAVWSADEARAVRVARRIRTGQVDVNGGAFNPAAPFGGVGCSGNGRADPARVPLT